MKACEQDFDGYKGNEAYANECVSFKEKQVFFLNLFDFFFFSKLRDT
jgi:hypothetical protein